MDGMECEPGLADLPLSDPRCVKSTYCCLAFWAGENASQAATPWIDQVAYGHWMTYYWVIILGFLTLWHIFRTVADQRSVRQAIAMPSNGPGISDKAAALVRFCSYRSVDSFNKYSCVTLPRGRTAILLLISTVFVLGLTFAERPYYRHQFGWGSPPLAIRTGVMAYALTPILVALAGKANIVSFLTGISPERLVVVHQYVAWAIFALSWIHTIPFFIASYYEPGDGGFARVKLEFYRNGGAVALTEYSGTPPLAMLFGLCVLSIPQVRNLAYEGFYFVHIGLAISYLGLLFWHAGDIEDTWAYLWATLAVWLFSYAVRFLWFMRSTNIHTHWFEGANGTVALLTGDELRVEVQRPSGFNFKPGQHAFLRFPSLSPLDNHPFTIASAPLPRKGDAEAGEPNSLLFLAKVRRGFTRRLATKCASQSSPLRVSLHLDGPYGGLSYSHIENRYDSLLLVAGGSGISSCLGWLQHVISIYPARALREATLVWAIRSPESFNWTRKELEKSVAGEGGDGISVKLKFYVTGSGSTTAQAVRGAVGDENEKEKSMHSKVDGGADAAATERMNTIGVVAAGRPDLRALVEGAAAPTKRLFVFGCGPASLSQDLSNSCAVLQTKVLRGEAKEISLHVETFGW